MNKGDTGGIVAINYGSINISENYGTIYSYSPEHKTGGIAGINYESGQIISCKNDSAVNSSGEAGGITGINFGVINLCTNDGVVEYFSDNQVNIAIGDITGRHHSGSITESVNNGAIIYSGAANPYNTELNPYIGQIAGYSNVGALSNNNNSWTGTVTDNGNLDDLQYGYHLQNFFIGSNRETGYPAYYSAGTENDPHYIGSAIQLYAIFIDDAVYALENDIDLSSLDHNGNVNYSTFLKASHAVGYRNYPIGFNYCECSECY